MQCIVSYCYRYTHGIRGRVSPKSGLLLKSSPGWGQATNLFFHLKVATEEKRIQLLSTHHTPQHKRTKVPLFPAHRQLFPSPCPPPAEEHVTLWNCHLFVILWDWLHPAFSYCLAVHKSQSIDIAIGVSCLIIILIMKHTSLQCKQFYGFYYMLLFLVYPCSAHRLTYTLKNKVDSITVEE